MACIPSEAMPRTWQKCSKYGKLSYFRAMYRCTQRKRQGQRSTQELRQPIKSSEMKNPTQGGITTIAGILTP